MADDLLTALQVCELLHLGRKGSKRESREGTLRDLRRKNNFPKPSRVAGKDLWFKEEVLAWVKRSRDQQRKKNEPQELQGKAHVYALRKAQLEEGTDYESEERARPSVSA